MKKNWLLILISLCMQALIGVAIQASNSDMYRGQYGGLGIILVYGPTSVGLILISSVVFFRKKQDRRLLGLNILFSLVMWFVIPLTYLKTRTFLRENRNVIDETKAASLGAAEEMGFTSYEWNPAINQVEIKPEKGKQHNLVIESKTLFIFSMVEPPNPSDTLAWLDLTLKEASVCLNADAYRELDSCIRSKNYNFSSRGIQPDGELQSYMDIYPSKHTGAGIHGCFISNSNARFGNFYVSLSYGTQTKKAL